MHVPAAYVRQRLPSGSVEPDGDRCIAEVGSDTPQMLALYLGLLDVDFEVLEGPDFAEHLEKLAARILRAVRT